MHCPRCGKENPEGANFCMHCGVKLIDYITKSKEQTKDKLDFKLSKLQKVLLEMEPEIWSGETPEDFLLPKILRKSVIFIIVGAWEGAELFDRPAAYKIVDELEKRGLQAIVLTDRYWWEALEKFGYDNPVIAVGGPISNSLSDMIARKLGLGGTALGVKEIDGRVTGYVWGVDARRTLEAVETFIKLYLDEFVRATKKVLGDKNVLLESVTKPEIKDREILERIERLEEEIKKISTVGDLRRLEAKYRKEDFVKILESFRIVLEMDRMSAENAPTEEFLDKLSLLKNYTEGFSDKLARQVDEFLRFMRVEQFEYLDDAYREKVRRFCKKLVDLWISEFLRDER